MRSMRPKSPSWGPPPQADLIPWRKHNQVPLGPRRLLYSCRNAARTPFPLSTEMIGSFRWQAHPVARLATGEMRFFSLHHRGQRLDHLSPCGAMDFGEIHRDPRAG